MYGIDQAGGGFNAYAAGRKKYGLSGRAAATQGPIGAEGMQGYGQRDQEQNVRKAAVLGRLQAAQNGEYMNPYYLRGRQ
jgi:hypothetical protein